MRRTLKCKLKIDQQDKQLLFDTLSTYASACNYLVKIALDNNIRRRYDLHYKAYKDVRNKFKLPSQLTITAIWKVIETLKANKRKKPPHFNPYSAIRLNYPRNFTFKYPKISFTTINGRVKAKIVGAYKKYLEELLKGQWQITESHLFYDLHSKSFYFALGLKKDAGLVQRGLNPIGIDLGIKRIAVTSTGEFFDNKKVLYIKHKYDYLRSRLQEKHTNSAYRHLKKLARKIRFFQRDINHQISKKLVDIARNTPDSVLVFENLKNIRRTTKVRKKQRKDHHRWSFRELQTFTGYKAEGIGIPVAFVEPRGTSHICSQCGSTDTLRQGLKFLCHSCGLLLDADLNASRNLAQRYILSAKADCQPANRNAGVRSYKPCNLLQGS